jgi:hypothetical protein
MSKFQLQENSLFTKDEAIWIVTHCTSIGPTQARGEFHRHFGIINHAAVPSKMALCWLFKRFQETGCILPKLSQAVKRVRTEDNIERVCDYFTQNPASHMRDASRALDMSLRTTHRILRKDLRWYPYVKKRVTKLTAGHEERRRQASDFLRIQPDRWTVGQNGFVWGLIWIHQYLKDKWYPVCQLRVKP